MTDFTKPALPPSAVPLRVLSTDDAAAHLGLSRSTLGKLRLRGTGPAYLKLGRVVRYLHEDLDRWLVARRITSTSQAII